MLNPVALLALVLVILLVILIGLALDAQATLKASNRVLERELRDKEDLVRALSADAYATFINEAQRRQTVYKEAAEQAPTPDTKGRYYECEAVMAQYIRHMNSMTCRERL